MKKLVAVLLVISAVPALAQQEKRPAPAKRVPVQNIDFGDGDLIKGTLATGEVDAIYGAGKRPDFGNLIQVRKNFDDKLRESVHEL